MMKLRHSRADTACLRSLPFCFLSPCFILILTLHVQREDPPPPPPPPPPHPSPSCSSKRCRKRGSAATCAITESLRSLHAR
eukprot:737870-Rhodomonas_salina.1